MYQCLCFWGSLLFASGSDHAIPLYACGEAAPNIGQEKNHGFDAHAAAFVARRLSPAVVDLGKTIPGGVKERQNDSYVC